MKEGLEVLGGTVGTVSTISKPPIERFCFDADQADFVLVKNNAFIDGVMLIDPDNEGKEIAPLSNMEIMIMQIAFCMAHQLNQKNEVYDASTDFVISINQFAKLLGIAGGEDFNDGSFHTKIRRALKRVDARRFHYPSLVIRDGYQEINSTGLFGGIRFISSQAHGSEVSFTFPKYLIPYLQKYGSWTWFYFASYVALHKYRHALILYELFSRHKNERKRIDKNTIELKVPLANLRTQLTISDSYGSTDIIRKILKPAIEHINTKTQMRVTLNDVTKRGRNLNDVVFRIYFSDLDLNFKKAMALVNDSKPFMSAKQIDKFSVLLAQDVGFASVYRQEDEQEHQFVSRIAKELANNLKVTTYYEYLKAVGFTSTRMEKFFKQKLEEDTTENAE